MERDERGTVVTFYSFKGGVGRSFLLANVATILANWGYRVLCIDFDLEAPGLEHYFSEYLTADDQGPGLVELIHRFAQGDTSPDWESHITSVGLRNFSGTLSLLQAGKPDGEYTELVQQLDWELLYEKGLGQYIETLRDQWTRQYDFVLIDSRTGITDIGGICTIQFPDILIPVFIANRQNLNGILNVIARATKRRAELPIDRPYPQVCPVLSRFEQQVEYTLSQEWLQIASTSLDDIYSSWLDERVSVIDFMAHTKIPYVPFWSYGERLATTKEINPAPGDISYSYQSLAALIAHKMNDNYDLLNSRDQYIESAQRRKTGVQTRRMRIFVSSTYKDLQQYRHTVANEIRKLDRTRYEVMITDLWTPNRDAPSVAEIRDLIQSADVLVGLYGFRMGTKCKDSPNPVIETIYRTALAKGIPVLAFFADDYAQIPPKFIDRGEQAKLVDDFRAELASRHAVSLFNTPDDAAKQVITALASVPWPPAGVTPVPINRSPEEATALPSDNSSTSESNTWSSAAIGAVAGSILMPGLGTIIGGVLGAMANKSISPAPKKIFVSYRRSDTGAHISRVYKTLVSKYSPDNVFIDADSIPSGVDVRFAISKRIESSSVVLVLIGPTWLFPASQHSNRYLADPNDYVRSEIRAAFLSKKRVIPVLVNRAIMPSLQQLPNDIQELASVPAVHLRPDPDFPTDLEKLLKIIDSVG
jgi:cellulose biosynthesis protein BcsQ